MDRNMMGDYSVMMQVPEFDIGLHTYVIRMYACRHLKVFNNPDPPPPHTLPPHQVPWLLVSLLLLHAKY